MNEHYNHLINVIFYQMLEYIVAPMILVFLTHFVLTKKDVSDKIEASGDKTIEYTLIALYSNLLFYFSISAHQIHKYCDLCSQVELALLTNCVFVAFVLIIHKDFLSRPQVQIVRILKFLFNWLWLGFMILVLWLILQLNLHLHGFHFDLSNTCYSLHQILYFFQAPNNFLLLFLMILVFILTFFGRKSQYVKSVDEFQDSDPGAHSGKQTIENEKGFLKIAKNEESKPELRAQSFFYAAEFQYKHGDLEKALEYINQSKTIAYAIPYPESSVFPIRKLKIQILIALDKDEDAKEEIKEIERQLTGLKDPSKKKKLEYFIDELKSILEKKP